MCTQNTRNASSDEKCSHSTAIRLLRLRHQAAKPVLGMPISSLLYPTNCVYVHYVFHSVETIPHPLVRHLRITYAITTGTAVSDLPNPMLSAPPSSLTIMPDTLTLVPPDLDTYRKERGQKSIVTRPIQRWFALSSCVPGTGPLPRPKADNV